MREKERLMDVKAARTRLGYTQEDMSRYLGITTAAYHRKENGYYQFSDYEKSMLALRFRWDYYQMNDYLYGGVLPDFGDGTKVAFKKKF